MERRENLLSTYKGLPREIYILFLSRVINSIGTFVYPLLALILTQKIGLTKGQAGIFISVLAVSQVPSMLLGGKLVDTLGRKKIVFIFQGLGALSFMLCGFVKPTMLMAYIIVIASNFYAISSPAIDAVVADITTPENRKSSFSLLYMGHNLGFAIGPILGGLLYKNFLSVVFIGDAVTTILSIILFVVFIKETMKKKTDSEVEVVCDSLNELEKHEEGSVFHVLLSRPILLYFAFIMFIYQFAYSQWGFTLPIQMGEVFKDNGSVYYGYVAGFNGVVVILFTPLVTALIHKISSMKAIALGGVLYAVAFGLLGFANWLPVFFISIFIMTIGEIMISINSGTFIANHTPASHRGRINSILPIIIGAGYTLGPAVMGNAMGYLGYLLTWSIVAAAVFVGAVFMRLLEEKEKKALKSI